MKKIINTKINKQKVRQRGKYKQRRRTREPNDIIFTECVKKKEHNSNERLRFNDQLHFTIEQMIISLFVTTSSVARSPTQISWSGSIRKYQMACGSKRKCFGGIVPRLMPNGGPQEKITLCWQEKSCFAATAAINRAIFEPPTTDGSMGETCE